MNNYYYCWAAFNTHIHNAQLLLAKIKMLRLDQSQKMVSVNRFIIRNVDLKQA